MAAQVSTHTLREIAYFQDDRPLPVDTYTGPGPFVVPGSAITLTFSQSTQLEISVSTLILNATAVDGSLYVTVSDGTFTSAVAFIAFPTVSSGNGGNSMAATRRVTLPAGTYTFAATLYSLLGPFSVNIGYTVYKVSLVLPAAPVAL